MRKLPSLLPLLLLLLAALPACEAPIPSAHAQGKSCPEARILADGRCCKEGERVKEDGIGATCEADPNAKKAEKKGAKKDGKKQGYEGGACFPNGTCMEGLRCDDDKCGAPPSTKASVAKSPGGYVKLPAGVFTMGSPSDEAGRDDDETRKAVSIKSFYIKVTEVTQGEWAQFSAQNPSKFKACGERCPVEQVSWYEGAQYMNWLSRREGLEECYEISGCFGTMGGGCRGDENEGKWCEGDYVCAEVTWRPSCDGYRYPTEAEWEYAARGGDDRATYNGALTIKGKNHAPELDDIAVYGGNSGVLYDGGRDCSDWEGKQYKSERCGTAKVKTKAANGYGLYDMLGNVWEWTWDAYKEEASGDKPGGGYSNTNPNARRVYRGCSWSRDARYCRAARRDGDTPWRRFGYLGLRPARSDR
jgi:sulfatase modifying factor 1